jgi:hypothetical protein
VLVPTRIHRLGPQASIAMETQLWDPSDRFHVAMFMNRICVSLSTKFAVRNFSRLIIRPSPQFYMQTTRITRKVSIHNHLHICCNCKVFTRKLQSTRCNLLNGLPTTGRTYLPRCKISPLASLNSFFIVSSLATASNFNRQSLVEQLHSIHCSVCALMLMLLSGGLWC